MSRDRHFSISIHLILLAFYGSAAMAADKPNVLVIWGDDVGISNVRAYNMGMMHYKTPNVDQIGRDGIIFTDSYAQQSCTAGRSAFIVGQSPYRTGLTKVGLPGAKEGISELDPTIAELLKNHGYATGQFGKNHLGDRDEHLPTNGAGHKGNPITRMGFLKVSFGCSKTICSRLKLAQTCTSNHKTFSPRFEAQSGIQPIHA